jgi:hypothetical protein
VGTSKQQVGQRRQEWIAFQRPGFVVLEPDGPWIDCHIIEVSKDGACLDVGTVALPRLFMLLMSPKGEVRRICKLLWRRGETAGVEFISLKDLEAAEAESNAAQRPELPELPELPSPPNARRLR